MLDTLFDGKDITHNIPNKTSFTFYNKWLICFSKKICTRAEDFKKTTRQNFFHYGKSQNSCKKSLKWKMASRTVKKKSLFCYISFCKSKNFSDLFVMQTVFKVFLHYTSIQHNNRSTDMRCWEMGEEIVASEVYWFIIFTDRVLGCFQYMFSYFLVLHTF